MMGILLVQTIFPDSQSDLQDQLSCNSVLQH